MNLKMIYFTALTVLTISCSQNEILENRVPSNAISFTNLNDRISSRAANEGNDDYGVYAFPNGGSPASTAWFMNNQQVNGMDNSYSPLKYWPVTGNLDFYAYAPYNSDNLNLNSMAWDAVDPVFDVTYTVRSNADEDFTIATPVMGANKGQVQLTFSHMLSKLDFNALLSDDLKNDGFIMTLNSVKLMVLSNQGQIALNKPQDGWSGHSNTATTYTGDTSYMIMPQPALDTEITLNVSITHNGADYLMDKDLKTYVLKAGDLTSFLQGTQYLFKITVGDTTTDEDDNPVFNVISFNAIPTPWTPGDIELTNP